MNIREAIENLVDGNSLSAQDMQAVMHQVMTGDASDAQIAGLLIALRMKGESVEEVVGATKVMRELSDGVKVDAKNAVDIVGTGGDGLQTFNVSTASAIVSAAAGATVAKHGNRSVSSSSGSADGLEALGVNLTLSSEQVAACVEKINIGFMFAVNHHPAMKHAIGPRKEMGLRTIFNILGPLSNPADVTNQLLGVYSADWLQPAAEVLQALGSNHVMVVHSNDGLDEISISAKTQCVELKNGSINSRVIDPTEYGFKLADMSEIVVDGVEQSKEMVISVLDNEQSAALDIVKLNAGAAIYVAGLVTSLALGIERAGQVLADGDAREKLQQLVRMSNDI